MVSNYFWTNKDGIGNLFIQQPSKWKFWEDEFAFRLIVWIRDDVPAFTVAYTDDEEEANSLLAFLSHHINPGMKEIIRSNPITIADIQLFLDVKLHALSIMSNGSHLIIPQLQQENRILQEKVRSFESMFSNVMKNLQDTFEDTQENSAE